MSDVSEIATVAWGYAMADIERLAWASLRRSMGAYILDTEERYQIAWHGVVVALFEATHWPHHYDLILGGMKALSSAAADQRHTHGLTADGSRGPNFIKYWHGKSQSNSDGFSDHLVEVMSLPSILGTLTPGQYQAIVAMAAHDNDSQAAADALGISKASLATQVSLARRRAKAAWYGDETPPNLQQPDTCKSGHPKSKHARKRPDGVWECTLCKRNAQRRRDARTRGDLVESAA